MLMFGRCHVGRFGLILVACAIALATVSAIPPSNASAAFPPSRLSNSDVQATTTTPQTTDFGARIKSAATWIANQGSYAYGLFLRGVERVMDPIVGLLYKMGPIG
jgi:hypothetical protein